MAPFPAGLKTSESSFFHCRNKKFTGVRQKMNPRSSGAENMANRSGDSLAMLLGETSPKISTTTVVTRVETPGPFSSPKNRTNSTVASEAEAMFTILLPIKMVESSAS